MSAVQPNTTSFFAPATTGATATPEGGAITAGQTAFLNGSARTCADGVSANPWPNPGFANFGNGAGGAATGTGFGGGFLGLIGNLINQLTTAINALNGGSATPGAGPQSVADANFASTGDPHLSETGTINTGAGTTNSVNTHFDSMSGHSDLLDSSDISGGYRLSTTVTDPNAKGVTYNQSATVSLNNGRDSVTVNKDGSYAIVSDGTALSLDDGQSLQLAGGAQVARNSDGSFTVSAQDGSGGSIVTNLTQQSYGVDVNAHVHDITVGGDIANYGRPPTPAAPQTQPQAAYASYQPSYQAQNLLDDAQLAPTPSLPNYAPVSFT